MTGPTTVANLFGHMGGRTKGLVQICDVVGFYEVADLEKMPKEVITTMKTYCESGQYQRGQEAATGEASMAMFGNTNQPVDVMVQVGHLFEPMPPIIRDDMAFIDRLHFYLPGWEIPKMRNDLFTDHYGFVVDYLAEALRDLRKHNLTEIARSPLLIRVSPRHPGPQGDQEDGLRAHEDRLPERSGHQRGDRGTA
jgi:ATP-dependent Lon protease